MEKKNMKDAVPSGSTRRKRKLDERTEVEIIEPSTSGSCKDEVVIIEEKVAKKEPHFAVAGTSSQGPGHSAAGLNIDVSAMKFEAKSEDIDSGKITIHSAPFLSRMPADKFTPEQASCFDDIMHAPEHTKKLFLYLRNKLLQLWLENPTEQLTIEDALTKIEPPYNSDGPLIVRIHAYLERYGYINFGVYRRVKPLPVTKYGRVIVIGAGIAGLTAARQLVSFGFDVTGPVTTVTTTGSSSPGSTQSATTRPRSTERCSAVCGRRAAWRTSCWGRPPTPCRPPQPPHRGTTHPPTTPDHTYLPILIDRTVHTKLCSQHRFP